MYSVQQQFYGQGGPAPTTIDLSRGNQFFVRFPQSHGATIYLYDKTKKIFVPFTSEEGFTAFTGGKTPEQAYNAGEVYDLPSETLAQLGVVVPDQYGFDNTGQVSDFNYYQNLGDVSGLDGLYGKTKNADLERTAADNLGILFTTLKNQGALSQTTFDKTIKDPVQLAKYINAWVYGGYTVDDIFRDVKAKEYGIQANVIDPVKVAAEHYKTSDYAVGKNNSQLQPPTNLNIDPELFNNPIFAIPGDAFKSLVPAIDINDPKFKEEASKIQDAYYDLLLQQMDADSAQAKAIADDNYRIFREQIQKRYGIQLADNAYSAWNQVQQLTTSHSERGIADSGIYNEALDRLLLDRRKADQRLRDTQTDEEELKRREYYVTKASPEQIQNDLTQEEKERWGLVPTQETLAFINNLKATYPDLTDEQVQNIKGSLVDQFGNIRSELYSTLYRNRYQTEQEKRLAQETTLYNKKLQETEKAYAPYTKSDNPFLQYQGMEQPALPPATENAPNPYSYSSNAPGTASQQFTKFVKANDSQTVYGVTNDGKYVGFDSWDNLLKANQGKAPNIETVSSNTIQTPSVYTPPQQTPQPQQQSTPASQNYDFTNKYGMYNGTVYDLGTGYGFGNQDDFFKASGVNSFQNVKFKTDYKPTFYKYSDSPTVYNAYNNRALDYDSYIKSGGSKDFSGIETRNR